MKWGNWKYQCYDTDFFDKILEKLCLIDKKNQKEFNSSGQHFSIGKEIILSTGKIKSSNYTVVFPKRLSFEEKEFFYWETPGPTISYRHMSVVLSTVAANFLPKKNMIPESVFSICFFICLQGTEGFRYEDEYRIIVSQYILYAEKGHWTRQHLWVSSSANYYLTNEEADELRKILFDFKKFFPKIKENEGKIFRSSDYR